jgi:hypothetical protein
MVYILNDMVLNRLNMTVVRKFEKFIEVESLRIANGRSKIKFKFSSGDLRYNKNIFPLR